MKIPFDIKHRDKIESGEYKVEFDGRPARIICWDKKRSKDNATIVALVDDGESEHTEYFFSDGLAICINAPALKIVTPEPEQLTEFEKALVSMLVEATGKQESEIKVGAVKDTAKELLELAGKEIFKGENIMTISGPGFFTEGETRFTTMPIADVLKAEYEKGKAEALKDMPRWKKATRDIDAGSIDFAVFHKNDGGDNEDWLSVEVTNRLYKGEYYLELSDLEKIPKDD